MSAILTFSPAEIDAFRRGGVILRECLQHVVGLVAPGITTKEIDRAAETFIRDHGGEPAFKGYHGYPATLCTSMNEECVHGIPGDRALRDGDIVSLDGGVRFGGLNTDACVTVPVGAVSAEASRLLGVTAGALQEVIKIIRAGAHVGDLSHAVQAYAEAHGFKPVVSLTGHGLGPTLHSPPDIPNLGEAGTGPVLPANTVIAVEPILSAGSDRVVQDRDGWTMRIKDGALSAHFEHTVLVLDGGCEVLA
jgi:methionyl aminopeptidase